MLFMHSKHFKQFLALLRIEDQTNTILHYTIDGDLCQLSASSVFALWQYVICVARAYSRCKCMLKFSTEKCNA